MRLTVSTLTTLVVLGLALSDEALASPFLWSNTPSVSPSNMKNEEIVNQKFGDKNQIPTYKMDVRYEKKTQATLLNPLPLLKRKNPKKMTEIERFIQDDSIRLVDASRFLLKKVNSCALGYKKVEEQHRCFRKIATQTFGLNVKDLKIGALRRFMNRFIPSADAREVLRELESTRRKDEHDASASERRVSSASKLSNKSSRSPSISSQVSNSNNNLPNALHLGNVLKNEEVKEYYVDLVKELEKTFEPKIEITGLKTLTLSAYDLVSILLQTMRKDVEEVFERTKDSSSSSSSSSSTSSTTKKQILENEEQYLKYLKEADSMVRKQRALLPDRQVELLFSSPSKKGLRMKNPFSGWSFMNKKKKEENTSRRLSSEDIPVVPEPVEPVEKKSSSQRSFQSVRSNSSQDVAGPSQPKLE